MTKHFEARIWEKAEHWTFDTTIDAKDEVEARNLLKKDYPAKDYSIRDLRECHR